MSAPAVASARASAARTTAAAVQVECSAGQLTSSEDVAGPVAAVVVAQVLHVGEQPRRAVAVAERLQSERQLARLGAGDPRVGGDAADAEAWDDEVVPPLVQRAGSRRGRGRRRRGPGSTSPSRSCSCPGTGRGWCARAWRSRPAASSHSGCGSPSRSARAMPARSEWWTLDEPASSASSCAGRRPSAHSGPRRCRRTAAAGETTQSRARRTGGHTGPRTPRRGDQPVVPHADGEVRRHVGLAAGVDDVAGDVLQRPGSVGPLACEQPGVGPLGLLEPGRDRQRHRGLDVVPHVGVAAGVHGIAPPAPAWPRSTRGRDLAGSAARPAGQPRTSGLRR